MRVLRGPAPSRGNEKLRPPVKQVPCARRLPSFFHRPLQWLPPHRKSPIDRDSYSWPPQRSRVFPRRSFLLHHPPIPRPPPWYWAAIRRLSAWPSPVWTPILDHPQNSTYHWRQGLKIHLRNVLQHNRDGT